MKSRYDRKGGYLVRGGFTRALAQRLQSVRYDGITCEFGTYNMLHVLAALRNENRLHHYAQRSLFAPSKLRLLEVFLPSDLTWRSQVLLDAITVYKQARVMLND